MEIFNEGNQTGPVMIPDENYEYDDQEKTGCQYYLPAGTGSDGGRVFYWRTMKFLFITEPIRVVAFLLLSFRFRTVRGSCHITRQSVERRNRRIFRFHNGAFHDKWGIVLQTFPSHDQTGLVKNLIIKEFAFGFRERFFKRIPKAFFKSFFE